MSCFNGCNGEVNNCHRASCGWLPTRWVLGIMAFFGIMNVFSLRVNLSAAIVGMVDYDGLKRLQMAQTNQTVKIPSDISDETSSESAGGCSNLVSEESEESSNVTGRLFLWDENTQGLALACYFYGYVCAQVLGAWIARKMGRVRVWGISMLVASICTILLPALLEIGFGAFVAARMIIGLFSGVSYPIMHGMWSLWAPPKERGKLLTLQFAGAPLGSFIVLPLSGALTKEFGWASVFYVTGMAGLVWSILWLLLMYDSPAEHPRISSKEKQLVEASLGHVNDKNKLKEQQTRSVPWLQLMTSIRVWSTIIPHFASNFAIFVFLTMLPTYLRTMLKFDVKASGALSSVPYIIKLIMFFIAGWSADLAISKGVKTIYVRKIWSAIGLFLPGVAFAVAGYTGCNTALIMFLFTIPIAVDTFTIPGFKTSMIEVAPEFAGLIFAIANTVGTTTGFLAPQIAGALRETHRDDPMQGWRMLFWLGSGIYFVGGLVFLIFGSSEVQRWAQSEEEQECTVEKLNLMEGLESKEHKAV